MSCSCQIPGCTNTPLFETRTTPTFCSEHLPEVYRKAGVELLELFTTPRAFLLTRCLTCGCEATYRLPYVVEKTEERVCRACFWRQWATWATSGSHSDREKEEDLDAIRRKAEENGWEYLGPLDSPSLQYSPHRVKCTQCDRIVVKRAEDIGWACPCRKNPKPTGTVYSSAGTVTLFKDSGTAAVSWWDHEHNPGGLWRSCTVRSRTVVSWCCPECTLIFSEKIYAMARDTHCPACRQREEAEYRQWLRHFEQLTIADVPELLEYWAGDVPPDCALIGSREDIFRFRCGHGHYTTCTPVRYYHRGCPKCQEQRTKAEHAKWALEHPESSRLTPEISSQWHPTKNGDLSLAALSPESRRVVWWKDPVCGHEFQAEIRGRDKYTRYRCPECDTILDSLAYHYPELAAEWSERNDLSPWQVRPTTRLLAQAPWWKCSKDPTHAQWQAMPASRVRGGMRPECLGEWTSRRQLEHWEEVVRVFPTAQAHCVLTSPAFHHTPSWRVDMCLELEDKPLVIAYDRYYWNRDETQEHIEQSEDLLTAGYRVCRLREYPLDSLFIAHDDYQEITVYPRDPQPHSTIAKVKEWLKRNTTGLRI